MKLPGKCVRREVDDLTRGPVIDSFWNSARNSVNWSVLNSVYDSIRNSVNWSVRDLVIDSLDNPSEQSS
jgi:hypothetical protein